MLSAKSKTLGSVSMAAAPTGLALKRFLPDIVTPTNDGVNSRADDYGI